MGTGETATVYAAALRGIEMALEIIQERNSAGYQHMKVFPATKLRTRPQRSNNWPRKDHTQPLYPTDRRGEEGYQNENRMGSIVEEGRKDREEDNEADRDTEKGEFSILERSTVLIQLRAGIISPAGYLAKIRRKESPRCLLEEQWSAMIEELYEVGVSTALGEDEMLKEPEAAPIVAKFMIAIGTLGQFQSVDLVAMGIASAGEQGRTMQLLDRSVEAASPQCIFRPADADDEEDNEAWHTTKHGIMIRTCLYDAPAMDIDAQDWRTW
ncbi:uncharacterized protein N7479_003865 [Penicillium vulpinum]|uniref:uncharacterized protein n=1 Tax=Penicillium vulpinum TaxID=29845 RepID=UPI00254786FB|nr:uncharacterized protein N7479_003865 [Penicillium vulpinum]KAJ5963989.1 hypothetical protein N7479_003865 [Penicillium vulpinum]